MSVQTAIDIRVRPWFADHQVDGRVVLPAVESMLLLAEEVARTMPGMDIRIMEQVRFSKFLEIPGGSSRIAAFIEYEGQDDGSVLVRLVSRVRRGTFARLQEHGSILFSPARAGGWPAAENLPIPLSGPVTRISARRIYRELVPFGSGYHTLRDQLYLTDEGAWGSLQAPEFSSQGQTEKILGSPFPLDGAFHAACVLGQRCADFVPFPVGLRRRMTAKPTVAGGSYFTRVKLISRKPDELVFDLGIFDRNGALYEDIRGLTMRDVSRGRIKPPAWLAANISGEDYSFS